MLAQLEDVGAVICAAGRRSGAGGQEAVRPPRRHRHRRVDPADRLLDHEQEDRRGATGALVLDVKVGSRRLHEGRPTAARELAKTMVGLGRAEGVTTVALLTDMSMPLGLTAGNALRWPSQSKCWPVADRPT